MKNVKFLFAFLFAALLSSCLDTEEKIVFNADNSGTYLMTVDMGRMLQMASSMGAAQSEPGKLKEKKDTTIYLKDILNTADNLSAEEKALYKDGVISVKMDEAKNEMKIVISSPFKNGAALTEIKNNLAAVMNKLKAFEKATGEKEKPEEEGNTQMGVKSANPLGDLFTFKAAPGRVSNTITSMDVFKSKIASDSTLGMIKPMTAMMGDFNYRTIIVLPKAVKKYDGPGSSISADKKTITFSTTLTEMLEHPEKVSFEVNY